MVRRGAADKLPSAPIKSDGDLMSRHYIISQSADICEEETRRGNKGKERKEGENRSRWKTVRDRRVAEIAGTVDLQIKGAVINLFQ